MRDSMTGPGKIIAAIHRKDSREGFEWGIMNNAMRVAKDEATNMKLVWNPFCCIRFPRPTEPTAFAANMERIVTATHMLSVISRWNFSSDPPWKKVGRSERVIPSLAL